MHKDHANMSREEFWDDLTSEEDTPMEKMEAEQSSTGNQQGSHTSAGKDNHKGHTQQDTRTNADNDSSSRSSHQEEAAQNIKKIYSHHSAKELSEAPAPLDFLIDGYIQAGALHMLFGESGCKKTFAVLDMALSIACKDINTWCKMDIQHGPVIYLAGEGTRGIKKRYKAWEISHNVTPEAIDFEIIDECFHLNAPDNDDCNIDNTIANIHAIYDGTQKKPALIVVDTMNRFYEGDENNAGDMAKYIEACTRLTREFDCAVLTLHHTGNAQENKNRARGSSANFAAMDIVIQAEARGDKLRLNQTKNKDSEIITDLVLSFDEITLPPAWNRKNGKPETSLVPRLSHESTHDKPELQKAKAQEGKQKLSPLQKRAREKFTEAVKEYGIRLHDEATGHDLAAVYIEDWRKKSYELSSADNPNTKRGYFNAERRQLFEEDKLLIKRQIGELEHYCLDMEAEGESAFRIRIISAITTREKL